MIIRLKHNWELPITPILTFIHLLSTEAPTIEEFLRKVKAN